MTKSTFDTLIPILRNIQEKEKLSKVIYQNTILVAFDVACSLIITIFRFIDVILVFFGVVNII